MCVIWNYDCCFRDAVEDITDFKQRYDTSISVTLQVESIVNTHKNNIFNISYQSKVKCGETAEGLLGITF